MTNEDTTLLSSFAAYWRSMGYAPLTAENYCRELRLLAERRPLSECSVLDLHAFLAERSEQVSAATLAVTVRGLRAFYRWRSAVLDCDDPARTLRSPKVAEVPVRSVTELEHRRLLASVSGSDLLAVRDRALLAVLWASGMRRSEIARMELSHVDLAEGTIQIPRTKTGKPRTVGLSAEAVKLLRAYLKRRHNGHVVQRLWIGRAGRPLTGDGLRQMLTTRCKEAGMRVISPHEYRRSLAERWLDAGGSETLLRYHSGWSSPAMVAKYVRNRGQALALNEHRRLLG